MVTSTLPRSFAHRRVALLVLNASDWSRQVHDGIAAFAREQGGWDFWLQPRGTREPLPLPQDWGGEGIICRIADDTLREAVLRQRRPAVNISWLGQHTLEIPKVMSDLAGCGRMAAEFFLKRGFHTVGYVGPQRYLGYEDLALQAVSRSVAASRADLAVFDQDPSISSPDLELHRRALGQWLLSLPKPCSVITWSTIVAREVVTASVTHGLRVPEEVAVLAIENDPLLSALSPVPISYVMQRPQLVGYAAAELLERMMSGEPAPSEPVLVAPEGIAECLSTDTQFSQDEIVSRAVVYIRNNAQKAIQVSDLTRELHISRRSLEDRFRRVLNRTPADEIRLSRLNHLKELLRNPELSLAAVAYKSGFAYPEVMIRFFKRETGQTPGCYRRDVLDRAYRPEATPESKNVPATGPVAVLR